MLVYTLFCVLISLLIIKILYSKYRYTRPRVVVSLTTSPKRINSIEPTINTILQGSMLPDMIYLNVPHVFKRDHSTYKEFPSFLDNPLITINRCEDIGPATKILSSIHLEHHPDTIYVSIDDDQYYPPDFLKTYVYYANKFPECVITGTTFMPLPKVSKYLPLTPCELLEGFSGVCYRKKFLSNFDHSIFNNGPKACMLGDDFILSNYLISQGVDILCIMNISTIPRAIKPLQHGLQEDALHKGANGETLGNRDNYLVCSKYLESTNKLYIKYYLGKEEAQKYI